MEILEVLFNPITLLIVISIAALGFIVSPYEIIYEDHDNMHQ